LCFDSDTAGQNAAERSLEALLENDLVVRVAEMPAHEDPDSLVRKSGRQKFDELVASAPDFFEYWIEKKATTTDLNSLGAKMQVARELAASVAHVRDAVMRGEIMNKISARLAIRVADFETLVKSGQPFRQGDAKVEPSRLRHTMSRCFVCSRCEMKRRGRFYSSKIGAKCWRAFLARSC
jgi:DNA primase